MSDGSTSSSEEIINLKKVEEEKKIKGNVSKDNKVEGFPEIEYEVSRGFAHDAGDVTEIESLTFKKQSLRRFDYFPLLPEIIKDRKGWKTIENENNNNEKEEEKDLNEIKKEIVLNFVLQFYKIEDKEILSVKIPKQLKDLMSGKGGLERRKDEEKKDQENKGDEFHDPKVEFETVKGKEYIKVSFFEKGVNGMRGQEYSKNIFYFDSETGERNIKVYNDKAFEQNQSWCTHPY